MVSEGKEQAIKHLSNADLAFIAVLLDLQDGLADDQDKSKNIYQLNASSESSTQQEQAQQQIPATYIDSVEKNNNR